MIDRSKIDGSKLVNAILDNVGGNYNLWWNMVEFIEDYMPPYPSADTKPTKVSIKCGGLFLRHVGFGCYIWDIHYGEDSEFETHENALLALMSAPIPPWMIKSEVWAELIRLNNQPR